MKYAGMEEPPTLHQTFLATVLLVADPNNHIVKN